MTKGYAVIFKDPDGVMFAVHGWWWPEDKPHREAEVKHMADTLCELGDLTYETREYPLTEERNFELGLVVESVIRFPGTGVVLRTYIFDTPAAQKFQIDALARAEPKGHA